MIYLYLIGAHSLRGSNSHMRAYISIETRVVIASSPLRSGNTLQMYGEVFGLVENTTSIIVRDFGAFISA